MLATIWRERELGDQLELEKGVGRQTSDGRRRAACSPPQVGEDKNAEYFGLSNSGVGDLKSFVRVGFVYWTTARCLRVTTNVYFF